MAFAIDIMANPENVPGSVKQIFDSESVVIFEAPSDYY